MARTVATLPSGSRITDFISFGILARAFPISKVHEALAATGKASQRQRDLPAHVVVYYVLALSLYMHSSSREVLRCLLEGLAWLRLGPPISIAGKSGISQARTRLGSPVMRHLHDELVGPVAGVGSKGPGTGTGGSSVWMAARWMSPTNRITMPPLAGLMGAVAKRPIPRSALCRWWRTERIFCSAARCRAVRPARLP